MNDYLPQHIVCVAPDALKPCASNARTHSKKQLRQIADSIRRFGFVNPVLIDDHNVIVAGHGRVEAAKRLGLQQVPTLRLSHLTDVEKRAYILADNRLAEKAGWDRKLLAIELQGLIDLDFEVEITGFEMAEVDIILGERDEAGAPHGSPEDDVPQLAPDRPVSQLGDLWRLGAHQLVCADSLQRASYDRVMDGDVAQLVVTDPPYNLRIAQVGGSGTIKHREFVMASGELSPAEFQAFLSTVFGHVTRVSSDGSMHFVFMDWRHLAEGLAAGGAVYGELKNIVVWSKPAGGMGSLYRSQHELILVWKNGTAAHINNVELGRHGRNRTNVWSYPGVNSFGSGRREELPLHPTVKPAAMIADAIKDCSNRGGVVLDPFCGSGTILIAAERTGRKARAIELDPLYVDVAVRRWQVHTGRPAVLAATGETFEDVEQRLADAASVAQVTK